MLLVKIKWRVYAAFQVEIEKEGEITGEGEGLFHAMVFGGITRYYKYYQNPLTGEEHVVLLIQ